MDDDRYRVVSSANNIALQLERQFGKSLVYIIKSKGPRTDPCGTPHCMVVVVDFCCYTVHTVFSQIAQLRWPDVGPT